MEISGRKPVLIAGPTASGKTSLAIRIARETGGSIVNADALQVYDCWRVLTARPSPEEEAMAPHELFGHVAYDAAYSVGDWLSDVRTLMAKRPLIIVGGTGLYFRALTEGLADIPSVPPEIRDLAAGIPVAEMLEDIDAVTRSRIDIQNPRRVQRAWEVQKATGTGLAEWHDRTPEPLIPLAGTTALVIEADTGWLDDRIARRFETMMTSGALEEAQAMLPRWDPALQSAQAIGAPELIAYLRGEVTRDQAVARAILASRQYAKRQRTWFRARMRDWTKVPATDLPKDG